ncbi:MAG: alpha-amylase family glycosyl hydrolase [Spirochaetaceae bacterium]|nr:alpha-amylase family glycosyl hydrolase [Spirochaetaceae bacterium]
MQGAYPEREFHISRAARRKYSFDASLYGLSGNVVLANIPAVREFARKVNSARNAARHPQKALRAGQLHAMGLIDEVFHYVVKLYREQFGADVFSRACAAVSSSCGEKELSACLLRFVREFPPLAVHKGQMSAEEYLAGKTGGTSNREVALEEMLMLYLANDNPAFAPFGEFFDDTGLRGETAYLGIIGEVKKFFETQPKFGPNNNFLFNMLKEPVVASPYSLLEQLDYIRRWWGYFLGGFLERFLRALDLIREEEKLRGPVGGGSAEAYTYFGAGYADEEFERFSPDRDWMPKVVMIAKSGLVWLDQLSRAYGRPVATLDAIPDEELELLARRGINGLWLIGLWERSTASKRIKELCGNPEAAASAYSLADYTVAPELGGWGALENLRRRAARRGIRLASDMVPNHTGIDSRWVVERPELFIQSSYPPFPGYSFNGENLNPNSDVGIFIEDRYYSREDAAVVFKRVHWPSGDTRYIYHGNDGTHMPWNDTAQLNFLLPEVREAVIKMIVHVAHNFPIIRFDAAMTLAKRHFSRLWYPEPGSGGDIPSRAERGLSREDFNRAFPEEFWREVVDRVAAECPDTLLLAEAFWMMEGYFVRTLGMHRVYNSAFMNMLKNEDNAKYRATIKNTQEFDKDILKRFVNFMNNPDEETAIAQFGDGDKYFGVCTLMVTMPGLPMFGHGQIEGFTEKYGMEYRRAYRDEKPNQGLVDRHEREIFPLMKKRYIFAEVADFLLYDLYDEHGGVNENIFAYSNRAGSESALVLYNNAFPSAVGWIRMSAAYMGKSEKTLVRRSLGDGLGLHYGDGVYCIFREQHANLWFIRSCKDIHERGLFVNLRGYETQVFLDMYEVADDAAGSYRALAEYLGGGGTQNIAGALRELSFRPLYAAYRRLLYDVFPRIKKGVFSQSGLSAQEKNEFAAAAGDFAFQVKSFGGGEDCEKIAAAITVRLQASGRVCLSLKKPARGGIAEPRAARELLFAAAILQGLGDPGLYEEWFLGAETGKFFAQEWPAEADGLCLLLKILMQHEMRLVQIKKGRFSEGEILEEIFSDPDVQRYAGVNCYNDETYFNREAFLSLTEWLAIMACVRKTMTAGKKSAAGKICAPEKALLAAWKKACEKSAYKIDVLFELLNPGKTSRKKAAAKKAAGGKKISPRSSTEGKKKEKKPAGGKKPAVSGKKPLPGKPAKAPKSALKKPAARGKKTDPGKPRAPSAGKPAKTPKNAPK